MKIGITNSHILTEYGNSYSGLSFNEQTLYMIYMYEAYSLCGSWIHITDFQHKLS